MSFLFTPETNIKNPLEIKCPMGAEGWEEMYPYYLLFSEENKDWEMGQFWFHDSMHHPYPLLPFETIVPECIRLGLGQNNSRIFMVPDAYGVEQRIVNGYVYFSPVQENDSKKIEDRLSHFINRTDYYYRNWNKAYENWKNKVLESISRLKSIEVEDLPEMEHLDVVHNFLGYSKGYKLLENYQQLVKELFLAWQYHFEMLNVGYIAYLEFINFCRKYFPSISDKTISQMIKGFDSLLFTPDQKLRELAQSAFDKGIEDIILQNRHDLAFDLLKDSEKGNVWLRQFEEAKDPWFYFSNGNGFYALDGSWIDNLDIPLNGIRNYIESIKQGKSILRNVENDLKDREKLAQKFKELLLSQEQKEEFLEKLELARTVAVYLEDHNFYIENWFHTVFWQKMDKIGRIATHFNFISEPKDLYYLNRWEVGEMLYELSAVWASGAVSRGRVYWPKVIMKRKLLMDVLYKTPPIPTFGKVPEKVTEPLTVTLFGITKSTVDEWQRDKRVSNNKSLKGLGAVSGTASGPACWIRSVSDIVHFKEGDILVCESLAPSWLPLLKKAAGVVAQIGGIMSHTAIICREFQVPCIVAVSNIRHLVEQGSKISIDGEKGTVEIL